MNAKTATTRPTATSARRDLIISRVFDAPRDLVWKTWTDPEAIKQWWGPKEFTAPSITSDFRVGGRFVYSMRGAGPDGAMKDYWNTGEHREIVPLKKIVATMSFADEHGNPVPASHYGMPGRWPMKTLLTVTFGDSAGKKTKLIVREVGIPRQVAELARLGWEQQFDKFEEVLALRTGQTRITAEPGRQEIIIRRLYDAPREIVFRACTRTPRSYRSGGDRGASRPS